MQQTTEPKTIFENDEIGIDETIGPEWRFLGAIENKTGAPVVIAPSVSAKYKERFAPFVLEPYDVISVQKDREGWFFINAAETHNIDIAGPERFREVDDRFNTTFADNYAARMDRER